MSHNLCTSTIELSHTAKDGSIWKAVYLPECGLNLVHFQKNGIEVIDQSTWPLFEERNAGLGALIGPHFHRKNPQIVPKIQDESLFPHIARVKAKGVLDPFSHGISRYAPWQVTSDKNSLKAELSGKQLWNGVALSALEGQNFTLNYSAKLDDDGLHIHYSVVSETDSLVGLHYYFSLPNGQGQITSLVQDEGGERFDQFKSKKWLLEGGHRLLINLKNEEIDETFHSFPKPCSGSVELTAENYRLYVFFQAPSEENCWQLYHPKEASFVCIEPISARHPRTPNLTVSEIDVLLKIEQI